MRRFLSVLLVLLAVVAGVVAVPALWVAQNVTDEDGFVASSRVLTEDDEVRSATADLLAARILEATRLPDAARERLSDVFEAAARQALEGDEVAAAWEESLRLTHQRALDGAGTEDTVSLEVAPLAALVTDAAGGLVEAPESLTLDLAGGPGRETLEAVDAAPGTGATALAAAGVLALLALVVSPRRGRTLAWLGAGAVLVAGIVAVGSRLAWVRAVDRASGLEATLTRRLGDVAQDSLDGWLVVLAVAGVGVLLVGLVVSAVAGRARVQRA